MVNLDKTLVKIPGSKINCQFKRHNLATRIKVIVRSSNEVVITVPPFVSRLTALSFAGSELNWIKQQIKKHKAKPTQFRLWGTKDHYLKHKAKATILIKKRLDYFNQFYNFSYNKILIKNQTTCWGSCSAKKNLSFNYKLIFLPTKILDYIVVHELCHLKEMNHSAKFWLLVEKAIPNYLQRRGQLKKYE